MLKNLVKEAGVNGLEVCLGFSSTFYGFLLDPETMEIVATTSGHQYISYVFITLSAKLTELLGQFPERRV